MKILFELITTQGFIGGGAEYVRKVFHSLLDYIARSSLDIEVVALIDSSIGKYAYNDLSPESLEERGVKVVDRNGNNINDIIDHYKIDRFFCGCAQYIGRYKETKDIKIPGVIVIHDLCSEEYADSRVSELPKLPYTIYGYNRERVGLMKRKLLGQYKDPLDDMKTIMELADKNRKVQLVTVSNYTKMAISYYFDYPIESIPVLYSCERVNPEPYGIDNEILSDTISAGKKYYLMLAANRDMKNSKNAFKAFKRFVECGYEDVFLVTTGCKEQQFNNHIPLGYLSDNDIVVAMKHSYALIFPTFFEGFGYPPVEAMKYGKPILCSNVTSMPEILGDAPIYFSPIYSSDIFRALNSLNDNNYDEYARRSETMFSSINSRQKQDLKLLLKLITE